MDSMRLNSQTTLSSELILDSLSTNITEFVYDVDKGHSFNAWFSWYADLFEKDAEKLDDSAKVRLLLRKLNPAAHERYTSFILPKLSKDFSFDETVAKLKTIFGSAVSTFNRRYQCLQTIKEESEDYITYSCRVNKACVDFKLQELKEEQFKSLIFVCGLKSQKDADIRMRLLSKINETQDITLEKIVEECTSLMNLKRDTSLIESSIITPVATSQAVRKNDSQSYYRTAGKHGEKRSATPKTPCWSCGGMHFSNLCEYKQHKCNDCGRTGHKEGYCACFSAKLPVKPQQQRTSNIVTVNALNRGRRYVETIINGVPVMLQLDSGSDITIISQQNWKNIGTPSTAPPDCQVKTASGD